MKERTRGFGFGSRSRQMAVEPLERRTMLAGNVNVFVSGGSLIVRGDNGANGVFISQVDDDSYAVTGFDFGTNGDSSTRINGEANGTRVFSGVSGDINVDLRGGNDVLGIGNSPDDLIALAIECGFDVDFGEGDGNGNGTDGGTFNGEAEDVVLQQQVEGRFFVPRNLIVNMGNGHDAVGVTADVENSAIINTGAGDDAVIYGTLDFDSDVHVGGSLIINTNGGNDEVCATLLNVRGIINVQTGEGHDGVEITDFDAGAVIVGTAGGHDFVGLSSFDTDREVVVTTGGGNDTVFIDDFSAGQGFGPNEQEGAGYVTVVTGAGNDNVELTFFEADGVVINTGAGNDGSPSSDSPITVEEAVITNHLNIITGAGNDLVVVEFVEARTILIDTGAGHDGTIEFPVEVYNVIVNFLTIVTGAGNDDVYVHAGDGEDTSTVANNLIVNTGAGNDIVQIIEQQIGGDLHAILGAGNDLAAIGFDDEIGPGSVETGMTVRRNLLVDAGAGNDQVAVADLEVRNHLFGFLGAGHDELLLLSLDVGGNALIDAGAGNDEVDIAESFIEGDATILMGAGNDFLLIVGSDGNGRLVARGGPGRDTFFNDLGITSNGREDDVDVQEFEVFESEEEIPE